MSRRGIIETEPPRTCERCGAIEETRPYGPNGERVCFQCGRRDPAAMARGFRRLIEGEGSA